MNDIRFGRVGVLGDGVAGWLAALALAEWRPSLDITVVGARDGGAPGAVALDDDALAWLIGYVGVDLARLWASTQPTLSLGVRYLWHPDPRRAFDAAFDGGDLAAALAHDGHFARSSLGAQLMAADRAPAVRLAGELRWLLGRTPLGCHVATEALEGALAEQARERGVRWRAPDGLAFAEESGALSVRDGAEDLSFDLLVDATSTEHRPERRSGRVEVWRTRDGDPRVRSTIAALHAGWCEVLPLRDRDHITYRYSPDHLDDEGARAELGRRFPGASAVERGAPSGPPLDALERSYRNVVPLGARAEAADPLGAPPLSRVVDHAAALLTLLDRADAHRAGDTGWAGSDRGAVEALDATFRRGRERAALIGGLLAWRAPSTPAWDEARADARSPALERALDELTRRGPDLDPDRFEVIALGLGLRPHRAEPSVGREGWESLATMRAHVARAALPHGEALDLLAATRAPLDALAGEAESWVRATAAPFVAATPTRGRSRASLEGWASAAGIPARWPSDLTHQAPTFPESPLVDFGKFDVKVPRVALAPRDQGELAATLRELAARRIPLKIRGAGHSNGGQVLIEGGAVVDVRALCRVVADDPDAELLTVEGGAWFEEAQVYLHRQGLGRWLTNHLMHWRSTIAGSLAVGGFGDTTHLRGLQTQMVRELVVMTLDGARHRVRPGDPLFDYTLAGRGQLGVVTEATLTTERRSGHITARCVRWSTVDDFLADAAAIVADGRYPIVRSRMFWDRAEVEGAVGRFAAGADAMDAARLVDLRAELTTDFQTIDYFKEAMKPKSDHWLAATPAVEFTLPCDPDRLDRASALVTELRERLIANGLAAFTPLGTSIMLLPTAGHPPLAPLPRSPLALMFALRPEMSPAEARAALPAVRAIGHWALERGGKLYLMCVEPETPDLLERQFGERLGQLRALKRTHDPLGLLNPGLLAPLPR